MKKLFLLTIALLLGTQNVFAQTTTPQTMREQMKNRIEQRVASSTMMRAKIAAVRVERIRAYFRRMINKLESAIERLEAIATKIENRIDKFQNERGKDVSQARAKLQSARQHIDLAKQSLQNTKDTFEQAITSDSPRENFEKVRAKIKETTEHIRQAHRALVDAIIVLKGASMPSQNQSNSSSTSSN